MLIFFWDIRYILISAKYVSKLAKITWICSEFEAFKSIQWPWCHEFSKMASSLGTPPGANISPLCSALEV